MVLVTAGCAGGVFDYASRLKEALGTDTSVQCLRRGACPNGASVFLQYSGYGYARKGAPLWLPRTLRAARTDIHALGIYFHELYATGHPWTSAFWMSPAQRLVAKQLVQLADFWITNREASAAWLANYAPDKPHAVLPVFSNVGEPKKISGPRESVVVVFGSPSVRTKVYQRLGDQLWKWAAQERLRIVDIGPPLSCELHVPSAVQFRSEGHLQREKVSEILLSARFGLVAYSTAFMAKSGVFASYAAHGICPIVLTERPVSADGLVPNTHYILKLPIAAELGFPPSDVGAAAHAWYQGHTIAQHADMVRGLFSKTESTS